MKNQSNKEQYKCGNSEMGFRVGDEKVTSLHYTRNNVKQGEQYKEAEIRMVLAKRTFQNGNVNVKYTHAIRNRLLKACGVQYFMEVRYAQQGTRKEDWMHLKCDFIKIFTSDKNGLTK